MERSLRRPTAPHTNEGSLRAEVRAVDPAQGEGGEMVERREVTVAVRKENSLPPPPNNPALNFRPRSVHGAGISELFAHV